jgi:hypothetical protein
MPTGIGTGIGALFSALGKRKLADAQMDIYGQRLRSQMAQQAAATALDDSKTNLNNTQLGGMTNYGPALIAGGMDPTKAAILAAAAQGSRFANLNTTNQGLGRAFLLGGIGDPQVNNTVAGIDNTKVGGGVAFNPTMAPDAAGQTFQNVGATDANVAAAFARAIASKAAAGASGARATLLGTQNTALLHPDQVPGASFNKPSKAAGATRTDQADAAVSTVNQMIMAHKMTTAEAQRRFNVMGRPDLAKRVYDPSLDPSTTGGPGG